MKTITIDQAELKDLLAGIQHATPLSFTSITSARLRKTNNTIGEAFKWTKINAFTATSYTSAIRRQEKREMPEAPATFVAQERSWGESVPNAPALLRRLDKETGVESYYLVAQVQKASKPLYLIRKEWNARRRAHLTVVPKEVVAPFLPAAREQTNQPVEKEIVWRTYSLTSLVALSIGGKRYRIRRAT